MRNLTSLFKSEQNNDNRNYLKFADFTFLDGSTLSITNADLWSNGMKFIDSTSGNGSFDIGSAIVNELTLSINNFDGRFDKYTFDGARVVCYIGLKLSTGIEKIRICTMTVTEAPYQSAIIINLTCQDDMRKFDADYSESKLIYPATRSQIIRDACEVCGVTLQTTTFFNDSYIVKERPSDTSLTFRQVIAWVAQIGCQWARCDEYGRLCLDWYNKDVQDSDRIRIEGTSNFTPFLDPIEITGIKVTEYEDNTSEDDNVASYTVGTKGYIIEIKNNKLIQKDEGLRVAQIIAQKCVGLTFYPFQSQCLTDISLEAGDPVLITGTKGEYKSYLTSVTLQPGNFEQISCEAKSPQKNAVSTPSLYAQVMADAGDKIKKERTARQKAIEALTKRLSESTGVFTTIVEQEDGSNIYYLHNKPTLDESDMVWKMTAEAWAVSTDGGKTWNGGMTIDGDVIARILSAEGINANWIRTGEFKVTDADGNIVFLADMNTGKVIINADDIRIKGKSVSDLATDKANTQINTFINNTYAPSMNNLQSQVDGKIQTWRQDEDPSLNWKETQNTPWKDQNGNPILDMDGNEIIMDWESLKSLHEGDLWYRTTDNTQWIYQNGVWVPQDLPNSVVNLINGKTSIYTKQPVPPYKKGELWITSFDNKEASIKTCVMDRENGEYNASDWIDFRYVDKDDVQNALNEYDTSLGQDAVFNKLTNGGADQGIYVENGKVYINATYILAGILAGKFINAKGIRVLDKNNDTTFYINDDGNVTVNAYEFALQGKGIKEVVNDVVELTQQQIFNILTNNGQIQGIYLSNGKIYINGEYIKSNTIAADALNVTDLVALGATIGGFTITNSGLSVTTKSNYTFSISSADKRISIADGSSIHVRHNNTNREYVVLGGPTTRALLGDVDCSSISSDDIDAVSVNASTISYFNGGLEASMLNVTGTKKRVLDTENYGKQSFYCYEMATPIFGDIGESVISSDGICIVDLDDIFQESVSTDIQYYVFLQKEGEGDCWIAEKTQTYFVVKGTPNLKFAFEIKARQMNYEHMRFADASETAYDRALDTDMPEPNYEESNISELSEPDYEDELINDMAQTIQEMEIIA